MEIAIISDSHDNLSNIERAVKYINDKKISTIIHCGDVCSPETLEKILYLFKGQNLHLVKGNADNYLSEFIDLTGEKQSKLKYHGQTGKLEINNSLIAFCHKPFLAKKMAESGKYPFIFYGHTHAPWQEVINGTKIINPGTLAGLFNKATFAIFDTKTTKTQLILLENK
jgi:putative phosphoesterase